MNDEPLKPVASNQKPEITAADQVAENSAEEGDDKKLADRLLSTDQWLRCIFMLLFATILCLSAYVMSMLVILQFVFSLVTGRDNDKLRYFGSSLAVFIFQILQFLTYNSGQKPFPFTDWPKPAATKNDLFT